MSASLNDLFSRETEPLRPFELMAFTETIALPFEGAVITTAEGCGWVFVSCSIVSKGTGTPSGVTVVFMSVSGGSGGISTNTDSCAALSGL